MTSSGGNLQTEVTLTLSEALLGFDRLLLKHLDGRGLRVNQPGPGAAGYRVFKTGDVVKVQDEGYPQRKSTLKGDLFIKIVVEMPTKEEMERLTADKSQVNDDATLSGGMEHAKLPWPEPGKAATGETTRRTNPGGDG